MEQLLIERGFSGRILDATSPGYAAALERDNLASERKARLIVFPRSERDLSIAIQAAKQAGEKIAVKCGGHNHSTANSVENGVVIDMGSVKMIHIDRENLQVNVGGGCLWGEVYARLDKEGFMCVGGGVSVVGVGGHITGGGFGPLSPVYGMACDNVVAARVVLADGRVVNASATQNQDLFWAIKGGASAFGIVAEFTLRTFPLFGKRFFRFLTFPGGSLKAILEEFSRFLQEGPITQVSGFLGFARSQGPNREVRMPIIALTFFGAGDIEEYRFVIGRFLKVANPLSDTVTKCETMAETATALNHMLLGSRPRRASKGVPITQLWPGLPQELWERWLAYTNANPDAVNSKITLECFMSARLRPELSCYPVTEARQSVILILEEHQDPAGDERAESFTRAVSDVVRQFQKRYGGRDLGLNINASSFPVRGEEVWLHNYPCLRKLKAKYDPDSLFSQHVPIEPDDRQTSL